MYFHALVDYHLRRVYLNREGEQTGKAKGKEKDSQMEM